MTLPGTVHLVGAGPGDPGLLTLRAAQLLAEADVVVYDALVSDGVMAMVHPGAERIYVGKHEGTHTLSQEKIEILLVQLAETHRCVVRLKGGDPFVFGRGGEEAQALRESGIDFTVVPGISSGIAGPAYAGIPLTHRDHAAAAGLLTGHEAPDRFYPAIDWGSVGKTFETLVVFMGVRRLSGLTEKMIASGKDPTTPVAVIRNATLPDQQVLIGTLGTIAQQVEQAGLRPPALVVIGPVAALHEELNWFHPTPATESDAILLIAHGSPNLGASDGIQAMAARLRQRTGRPVGVAFLQCESPSIEEAVAEVVAEGATTIDAVPLFLASGGHVQRDIPTQLESAKATHPGLTIRVCAPLGFDPGLDGVVLRRLAR
ncbi:MAG: uroporphyrinogen-III C-methyltransferase [Alphaproteobacteria bacterium CG_4_10_14_0_2_um_filter_63_37]|nr:MAG: uroporphyrinogen-III C-methyltransferase [Proteobacteria bacterium CG1_02_64_396]PJA25533.1 MAG: uroporphyrinogen-III C-methyltransferase [Alphaproteobacteria bacterium CG_4_10_14_0_2_um_filter_63_37]